ncbi:hypothetical protein DBR17_14575 [Sphingomonas sp. HMWF008]|nr:hypothetical protein DBR17_14575 [Sphingomonas sp. HMWF008]
MQAVDFVTDQRRVDTVLDRLNQLPDGALGFFQFGAPDIQRGVVIHTHRVEVLRILLAKHLRQLGVHELAAQRSQNDLLQALFTDRQTVRASALVAPR